MRRLLLALLVVGWTVVMPPSVAGAQEVDICAADGAADLETMLTRLDTAAAAAFASIGGDTEPLAGQLGGSSLEAVVDDACTAQASAELGDSALVGPCQGIAVSYDGGGKVIDAAADFNDPGPPVDVLDGGKALTAGNPFEVDVDGFVLYSGFAGPAGGGPTNHSWEIKVGGLEIDSGGDDNADLKNTSAGDVDLAADNPVKINGLIRVSGTMVADGGFFCDGEGYFRTTGGLPIGLIAGGVLLALAAAYGLAFNARPTIDTKGAGL
jgi:hypothetical protein